MRVYLPKVNPPKEGRQGIKSQPAKGRQGIKTMQMIKFRVDVSQKCQH